MLRTSPCGNGVSHALSSQKRPRAAPPSHVMLRSSSPYLRSAPHRTSRRQGCQGLLLHIAFASAEEAQQAVEVAASAAAAPYVPSPMDYSTLVPQLVSMVFLLVCLGYYQLVLAPTAQLKFKLSDKGKRDAVKDILKDETQPVKQWLYRLWLKPMARPRGDQTKGGTVIPGLTDQPPASKKRMAAAEVDDGTSASGKEDNN